MAVTEVVNNGTSYYRANVYFNKKRKTKDFPLTLAGLRSAKALERIWKEEQSRFKRIKSQSIISGDYGHLRGLKTYYHKKNGSHVTVLYYQVIINGYKYAKYRTIHKNTTFKRVFKELSTEIVTILNGDIKSPVTQKILNKTEKYLYQKSKMDRWLKGGMK